MPYRKKILIIENDDFLREIIGNLLHKNEYYIINSNSIQTGIEKAQHEHISYVILGTSCQDYKGKNTLNYIKRNLGEANIYILNTTQKNIPGIEKDNQMKISELSIKTLLQEIV